MPLSRVASPWLEEIGSLFSPRDANPPEMILPLLGR